MVNAVPEGWIRPSPGSLLDRWLHRRREVHPDAFLCGVRVLAGSVPGERRRWRYRPSGAERAGRTVSLAHGPQVTLRVVPDPETLVYAGNPSRPGHAVFAAAVPAHDARVQISVELVNLARFGLDVD